MVDESKNKECWGSTLGPSQAAWFLLNTRRSGMYTNILEALVNHRVSTFVKLALEGRMKGRERSGVPQIGRSETDLLIK